MSNDVFSQLLQSYNKALAAREQYYFYVLRTTNLEKVATTTAALRPMNIGVIRQDALVSDPLKVVEETNPNIKDNAGQKKSQQEKELRQTGLPARTFALLYQCGAIELEPRFEHHSERTQHLKRYATCQTAEDFLEVLASDERVKIVDAGEIGRLMAAHVLYGVDDSELDFGFLTTSSQSDAPNVQFEPLRLGELVQREKDLYPEHPEQWLFSIAMEKVATHIVQHERGQKKYRSDAENPAKLFGDEAKKKKKNRIPIQQLDLRPADENVIREMLEKIYTVPAFGPEAADYYKVIGTDSFLKHFYELLDDAEIDQMIAVSTSYLQTFQQDWQQTELTAIKFPKEYFLQQQRQNRRAADWQGKLIPRADLPPLLRSVSAVLQQNRGEPSVEDILTTYLENPAAAVIRPDSARGTRLQAIWKTIQEKTEKTAVPPSIRQDALNIAIVGAWNAADLEFLQTGGHTTTPYTYADLSYNTPLPEDYAQQVRELQQEWAIIKFEDLEIQLQRKYVQKIPPSFLKEKIKPLIHNGDTPETVKRFLKNVNAAIKNDGKVRISDHDLRELTPIFREIIPSLFQENRHYNTALSDKILHLDPRSQTLGELIADHGLYLLQVPPQDDPSYDDYLTTVLTLLIDSDIANINNRLIVVGNEQAIESLKTLYNSVAAHGFGGNPVGTFLHIATPETLQAKVAIVLENAGGRLGADMVKYHDLSLPWVAPETQQKPSKDGKTYTCLPIQLIGSASSLNPQLENHHHFRKAVFQNLQEQHQIIPLLYEGGGYDSEMGGFSDHQIIASIDGQDHLIPHHSITERNIAAKEGGDRFQGLHGSMTNNLLLRTADIFAEKGVILMFAGGAGSLLEAIAADQSHRILVRNDPLYNVYAQQPLYWDSEIDLSGKTLEEIDTLAAAFAATLAREHPDKHLRLTAKELQDEWGAVAVENLPNIIRKSDLVTQSIQALLHGLSSR